MMSVAPSVTNRPLLLAPTTGPIHVRNPSQLYTMEPLYAKVERKPRNTPEDRQQNSLEAFYGGKESANGAAFVIQRAVRAWRLRKQFANLLNQKYGGIVLLSLLLSETSEVDTNEVNVDTGLPMQMMSINSGKIPEISKIPDDIDLLILQAAGLETYSSTTGPIHVRNPSQPNCTSSKFVKTNRKDFRRTQSFKVPSRCKRTETDQGPGPIPQPCPALKGFYDVPKPPQRTVSFLARPQFPNKVVTSSQQRPLPQPPTVVASASSDGIFVLKPEIEKTVQQQQHHLRSYSSPAPLSPLQIPKDQDEPLPPPPYISPPLPTETINHLLEVSNDDQPLPPPPPELITTSALVVDDTNSATVSVHPATRQPCDSSSSASSIDSGFRSSYLESPTHWTVASPNLIVSPESLHAIRDVVFEPQGGCSTSVSGTSGNASVSPTATMEPLYGKVHRPPHRNYSSIVKKKSVKFHPAGTATAASEAIDDVTLRRQYRVGLNLFNQNPELGMEYLMKKDFVDYSPSTVGKFLRGRKGLSKKMMGHYLCQLQRPFNLATLHCFVHEMDFSGLHLDIALRHLYQEVTPPNSEAQKVEKIIEVFSKRYIACNQLFANQFRSPDAIFVLSYAIVLLNTDLHSKAMKKAKRMKREDFVRNLRGADQGADLDTEMLQGIYDRIKENELKAGPDHVSQVSRVEETILCHGGKKGKQQNPKQPLASDTSRRLVCFCRLTEVPDAQLHKKAKIKADAHQRGIFLFNDLLVVTKTLSKKDSKKTAVQYQYRFFLELRDLRINVFSTNQFPFGVQLQDKLTGKIAGTFNSRSQADQQRFVNDLEESIAEMTEMEHAKSILNDDNARNQMLQDEDNAYETLC